MSDEGRDARAMRPAKMREAVEMPFVREWSDMWRFLRAGQFMSQFTGAEMLVVSFRTDPKTVAAVLPRPLRPARSLTGKYEQAGRPSGRRQSGIA
jgi:hypothetical protein